MCWIFDKTKNNLIWSVGNYFFEMHQIIVDVGAGKGPDNTPALVQG